MSAQLFAVIKKSSKYAHQQPRDAKGKAVPFEVEFADSSDVDVWTHVVFGADNRYRIADLSFFAKVGEQFVRLS